MRKKVILILGASSDLAIAFIHQEIGKYDYIIAHYHSNGSRLLEIQKEYTDKVKLVKADFASIQELQNFIDEIKSGIIPNYIIHFPAVECKLRKFEKIAISDFQDNLQVSVLSVILILQNLLPLMAKEQYGKIVFILSIHTITDGHEYISDYLTAKYSLLGLMKALTVEYKEKGIRINGVSPDMIETKFISGLPRIAIEKKKNENMSKELLSVSDIVPTIAYLLDEASDCFFGQNIGLVR